MIDELEPTSTGTGPGETAPKASPGEPAGAGPVPAGPGPLAVAIPIVLALLMLTVGVVYSQAIKTHSLDLWRAVFGEPRAADGDGRYYTCGMHPWVILPRPGDCPICHMELTPIDPSKFTGKVEIDPVVVQNIGVRVARVERGPLAMTVRTVGSITYDETRVSDVNTKLGGWIEKLYVNWLGAPVTVGQPLAELYAPDLYTSQAEYLGAVRAGDKRLQEAARTRLRYLDVTDEQISELEKHGTPSKTIPLLSQFAGLVVEKKAYDGMRFEPRTQLYRIADLTKVWALVTLFESQLPYVRVGGKATVTLPYGRDRRFLGRVAYVYPTVDPRTREVKVRVELDNPDRVLRPGMFVGVVLETVLPGDRVIAPRAAVIDTGTRKVAFVSLGDGKFEPRNVRVGAETENGRLEIVHGLSAGEMVVVSGQFLLDSEAKMRESLARMMKGNPASEQKAKVDVAGQSEIGRLPEPLAQALEELLGAAMTLTDRMASDTTDGTTAAAATIASAIRRASRVAIPDAPHFWHEHSEAKTIEALAEQLAKGPALDDARVQLAALSEAVAALITATGVPPSYGKAVHSLHCPMYQKGAVWLQSDGPVRNPYYGAKMLECFDSRRAMPQTGQKPPAGAEAPTGARAAPTEGAPAGDSGPHGGQDAPGAHGAPATQAAVDRAVAAYLALSADLAKDSTAGAAAALQAMKEAAQALASAEDDAVRVLGQRLAKASVVPALGLAELRRAFRDLSSAVIALVEAVPPSAEAAAALHVAHCPMEGSDWLQTTRTVLNPYMGSKMPECGSITRDLRTKGP